MRVLAFIEPCLPSRADRPPSKLLTERHSRRPPSCARCRAIVSVFFHRSDGAVHAACVRRRAIKGAICCGAWSLFAPSVNSLRRTNPVAITDTEIERFLRHSLSYGRMRLLWLAIPGRILTISFISKAYLSWSRRRGLWSYCCLSDRKCKRTARVSRARARVLQIIRCSYDFANIRTVVLLT
jgi:hypothetical protein